MAEEKKAYYANTNGVPMESDGRVTHVGVKSGDLSNRVVSVGSLSRAKCFAKLLDAPEPVISSARGFTTFTGLYEGVRVSIVATGMGAPMMDFLVREARAVTAGAMVVARLGTCGSVGVDPNVVVANTEGSVWISRNSDAFFRDDESPYLVSKPVKPDEGLARALSTALEKHVGSVKEGLNASTDSFYCSQGRIDPNFEDKNVNFLDMVPKEVISMDMESFQLLHLAKSCKLPIAAATGAIVCADRVSGRVIAAEDLHATEALCGKAVLEAVAHYNP